MESLRSESPMDRAMDLADYPQVRRTTQKATGNGVFRTRDALTAVLQITLPKIVDLRLVRTIRVRPEGKVLLTNARTKVRLLARKSREKLSIP